MKYADLLKKYRAGSVEESDLTDVTTEDWMKVRLEGGEGLLNCALELDALVTDEQLASKKKDKDGKRSYGYVMVSDGIIPPFNDRVMANAWDTKEFKYRGSNVLYDHNIEESRPPIGKASNLTKGVEMKRGGQTFKALTGDVTFADADVYPFAGMVENLVEQGLLTNGSVGFDIVKMRAPSEDEQEEHGMKAYSAIIQKANLIEFSITPLGRDKNAQKLGYDGVDPLEERLAAFAQEGVYPDDVIGSFRESLHVGGDATRFQIQVPDLPSVEIESDVQEPTWDQGVVAAVNATDCSVAPITTNGNTFTITNEANPVTFADVQARETVESLKHEIAELWTCIKDLREQLAQHKESSDEDFYDLLFDLSDQQEGAPDADESQDGDDSPGDLFTIANDLGFTP